MRIPWIKWRSFSMLYRFCLIVSLVLLNGCSTFTTTDSVTPLLSDRTALAQALEAGMDINAPLSLKGDTLLHQALTLQQLDLAQWLINQGANPFVLNVQQRSAIDIALESSRETLHNWAYSLLESEAAQAAHQHALNAIATQDSLALIQALESNQFYWYQHPLLAITAVDQRCSACIKALAQTGYRFTQTDSVLGVTALFVAIHNADADMVKQLSQYPDVINQTNEMGWNALHAIASSELSQTQQLDMAHSLIAQGIHLNAQDNQGDTPLLLALQNKRAALANLLIQSKADTSLTNHNGWTPLMHAVHSGLLQVVDELTRNLNTLNHTEQNGWNALHLCVSEKNATSENTQARIAQLLIERGINLDARNNDGNSALQLAVMNKRPQVVRLLLDAQADPSLANQHDMTPLMRAVQTGQYDLVLVLSGYPDALTQTDISGWTALHFTANRNNQGGDSIQTRIAQHLLAKGADVNAQSKRGITPLRLAVMQQMPKLTTTLLNANADASLATIGGITPLMHAVNAGDIDAINALLRQPHTINLRNHNGWTALHYTAYRNNRGGDALQARIARLLIAHGADIHALNKDGLSALDLAIRYKRSHVTHVLQELGAQQTAAH